ncbi:MAG: hypothetical protein ACK4GC_04470 [Paracoccaceae bacterium]
MADICHNTTGLPALQQHCQNVQSTATQLCAVIEAIDLLDGEGIGANAITALIGIARSLAEKINSDLDGVNLPNGGAA